MTSSSLRLTLLPFAFCSLCLIFAHFVQWKYALEPCPLCLIERGILYLLTGLYFLSFLQCYTLNKKIINGFLLILSTMFCLLGVIVSARHVWLQSLPVDQVPSCGPGLEYMLSVLPLTSVIKNLFTGAGECAVVEWRFLTLSLAQWVLLIFIGLSIWETIRIYLFRKK